MPSEAQIKYKNEEGKTVKANDFRDTEDHWAQPVLRKWSDYAIIEGFEGYFRPNDPIKRGDLAIVLDRFMGLSLMSSNYYDDMLNVPTTAYYRDELLRVRAAGYFEGVEGALINPDGNATREEFFMMLSHILHLEPKEGVTRFKDDYTTSSWAHGSVVALERAGYIKGDDTNMLHPQATITRAEIITMLNNVAPVYLPRKDTLHTGSVLRHNIRGNMITARAVELQRSTIGGDVICTPTANRTTLKYTQIGGTVYFAEAGTLELYESRVKGVSFNGRGSLVGGENVEEVYCGEYSNKTRIEGIPEEITLSPGIEVILSGEEGDITLKNETRHEKRYVRRELWNMIAEREGYVKGGPRISGVKITQNYDNEVEVTNITVKKGKEDIDEVGVLIGGTGADEAPTLDDYEDKERYKGRTDKKFKIEVGEIEEESTYVVYAIDEEGRRAYSEPMTLEDYEYDIDMHITGEEYPKEVGVEVELEGENLPEIRRVTVLYGYEDEREDTDENREALREVRGTREDEKVYEGKIKSRKMQMTGRATVYEAPVNFGYLIEYTNGVEVKKYPVLRGKKPANIDLVKEITTGYAIETDYQSELLVKGSTLYVRESIGGEEVRGKGIVYKQGKAGKRYDKDDLAEWKLSKSQDDIEEGEYEKYTTRVYLDEAYNKKGYSVYYAAYVATTEGYSYGKVREREVIKEEREEEDGPKVVGTEVYRLTKDKALAKIQLDPKESVQVDLDGQITTFRGEIEGEVFPYNGGTLRSANGYQTRGGSVIWLEFEGLKDEKYEVDLRLKDLRTAERSRRVRFEIQKGLEGEQFQLGQREQTEQGVRYPMYVNPRFAGIEVEKVEVINTGTQTPEVRAYVEEKTTPLGLQRTLIILDPEFKAGEVQMKLVYYQVRNLGEVRRVEYEVPISIKAPQQ